MKINDPIFRTIILLLSIGFVGLGLWGALDPTSISTTLLNGSLDGLSVMSHFRFVNVLFASFGLMLFLVYRDPTTYRPYLLIVGAGLLIGGIARTLGIFVDGVPGTLMIFAMIGEYLVGILCPLTYRVATTR